MKSKNNNIVQHENSIVPHTDIGQAHFVPDIIFHNGIILTMENRPALVQAIAIAREKILAVGSDCEILALKGPNTQIIDLCGKTLMPGFEEGHTHVLINAESKGVILEDALEMLLGFGLTSVTEMAGDLAFIQKLQDAEKKDMLRLRVNVFPSYNFAFLDEKCKTIIINDWLPTNRGPILDSRKKLRVPGIKIFVDGGSLPGRGLPALTEPYPKEFRKTWSSYKCRKNPRGNLYIRQKKLNNIVAEIQNAGFRAAFHAMGDRAIDVTLNAIEYALAGKSNEMYRHQIQHNSLLRPDQVKRFVNLRVLASVRGYHNTCSQKGYPFWYGQKRYEWAANRFSLVKAGIHAYAEGDFGWTADPQDRTSSRPINPFLTLYGLVTHKQLREDGTACIPDPWIAKHQISVGQALRMVTIEPAYAVSQEDVTGSLAPGKYADLIILSDNPLALTYSPDAIKDISVLVTMVGGHVEYCKPGYEALCPIQ